MQDIFNNTIAGLLSGGTLSVIGLLFTYLKNKKWTKNNVLEALQTDNQIEQQIRRIARSYTKRKIMLIGNTPQGRLVKQIIETMPHLSEPEVKFAENTSNFESLGNYDLIIITEDYLRDKQDRVSQLQQIKSRKTDKQALIAYAPDFDSIQRKNGFLPKEQSEINQTMNATITTAQGRLQADILALLQVIPSSTQHDA
jgi:hypothetical protein